MSIHLNDAQANLMLSLLREIRDVLREIATPLPEPEPAEPGCEHAHRIDFSTLGGGDHWQCQDCGLEYQANATALMGAKES